MNPRKLCDFWPGSWSPLRPYPPLFLFLLPHLCMNITTSFLRSRRDADTAAVSDTGAIVSPLKSDAEAALSASARCPVSPISLSSTHLSDVPGVPSFRCPRCPFHHAFSSRWQKHWFAPVEVITEMYSRDLAGASKAGCGSVASCCCQPPVGSPRFSVLPGVGFIFSRCSRQFQTPARHVMSRGERELFFQSLLLGVKRCFRKYPFLPRPPPESPCTFH